jgi:hypothetical protein
MNKFAKRLIKTNKSHNACFVLGNGFGRLEDVAAVFRTVFIFNANGIKPKARNIVYREDLDRIGDIADIEAMLVDLDHTHYLKQCVPLWIKNHCSVLIEHNDCLERPAALPLWDNGYRALEQHGFYHVWKRI